jgi:AcrR family transcriptional regulator
VLEAAARLFHERGYAGTAMGDVAQALGISRPGLYYYFASKDAILEALVEEVTVAIGAMATSLASSTHDPEATLREMTRRHAGFVAANATIFHVLTHSQRYLPAPLRERNARAKAGIFKTFERVIADGVGCGAFRAPSAAVAAFTVIGMCSWCASWFRPDGPLTADQVAEQIADMAVASLRDPDRPFDTKHFETTLSDAQGALDRLSRMIAPS